MYIFSYIYIVSYYLQHLSALGRLLPQLRYDLQLIWRSEREKQKPSVHSLGVSWKICNTIEAIKQMAH